MLTDELLTYLLDGKPHLLAQSLSEWLANSRRFATFATTFRDKIRKKLRVTQDTESLLDLRLELETAFLLLQDRNLSLVYEPQPIGKTRGPDYAVSFTTSLTFMLEVTRVRPETKNPSPETLPALAGRVADAVSSKLSQLLPQERNVLLIGVDALHFPPEELQDAILRLQKRVERNDTAYLHRHRFRDRADFFHHYQRLSEILVREATSEPEESLTGWVNPQAKHPLPVKVRMALHRALRTDY